MALVHELEKTGNWLFRRRSWFPILFVVGGLAYISVPGNSPGPFSLKREMIWLGVTLLGELIRILTVGFAPGSTSGRNTTQGQVAKVINNTGAYSMVRHPLYVGNYLMWLGPVLFLGSVEVAIIFSLVYWIYYERIIFAEEQFLRSKFPGDYDKWAEETPAFLPSFRNFRKPELSFSLKTVIRREYTSVLAIFIIFAFLDFCRNYLENRELKLSGTWLYLLASALVIWIVVRILHKRTRFFRVEGR